MTSTRPQQGEAQINSKKASHILRTLTKTDQYKTSVIKVNNGPLLTESTDILKRWTAYCNQLYNFQLRTDASILQSNYTTTRDPADLPVLREVMEKTVNGGKSLQVGEETTKALTPLCQRIW